MRKTFVKKRGLQSAAADVLGGVCQSVEECSAGDVEPGVIVGSVADESTPTTRQRRVWSHGGILERITGARIPSPSIKKSPSEFDVALQGGRAAEDHEVAAPH